MKNVAVVLSGCGYKNGSEITEAISSLIALGNEKARYTCFAPRDWIEDSNRISRDSTQDLKNLDASKFDAILFPGGYGAAKNLSTWATQGAACTVLPEVETAIRSFHKAGKPIGAICIAPAIIAKVLGQEGVTVTIGNDKVTAQEIVKTGAQHEDCPVEEYISDREHKVLTTPAYMYETKPHLVFQGISKMVKELVEMA
jgi:enhancing lycopene biosynthesis protein 2